MSIQEITVFAQLAVSVTTLLTLVWGFLKAIVAARNAETAARLASASAIKATAGMQAVAENVQKIEIATNSMKDALIVSTERAAGLAGEERGRQAAAREIGTDR